MAILPFAVLLGLGLLAAVAWSVARLLRARRRGRLPAGPVVILLASGFACWLGASLFLYVAGALSHSSHAVRDALPGYAAAFVVFVAAPVVLVALLARGHRRGGYDGPRGGGPV